MKTTTTPTGINEFGRISRIQWLTLATVLAALLAPVAGFAAEAKPPHPQAIVAQPKPAPSVPDAQLPQDKNGNFSLLVNNQSAKVNPVEVIVVIDGKLAVNGAFNSGAGGGLAAGHAPASHVFKLTPGKHTLTITSKNGAAMLQQEITIKDKHWAAIDYWSEGPDAKGKFTFLFRDKPIQVM